MNLGVLAEAQSLLEELERRKRERALADHRPSPPQDAFYRSPASIVLFCGCNGSGKSTALVCRVCSVALGYEPWSGRRLKTPPTRSMLVVRSFAHAGEEDITPIIEQFLPASQIESIGRLANGKPNRWTLKNKSVIKIMSYEQSPEEFEGTRWDFIGFNEPPPNTIYAACLRGMAKGGGRMAFAMTPLGANAVWIYADLYQKADGKYIDVVEADMDKGHCFMSPEKQAEFKAGLDPDDYASRVHGYFRHLEGRVYKQFDPDVHILAGDALARARALAADPAVPKGLVVDPHDRKPFACAWFLVTPADELIFFKEWPEFEFTKAKACDLDVADYAKLFVDTEAKDAISPVIWRLMDPNYGVARRVVSDESIRDRFDREGLSFDTDIDDQIEAGHLAVRERLNERRLFITPDCQNILFSMRNYCWDERPDPSGRVVREKPSEVGKDFADCVRYACMSVPGYISPLPPAQRATPDSDPWGDR